MLENYFVRGGMKTTEAEKRLAVVQAALEIAKASVGASTADNNNSKVKWDLANVTAGIEDLADAIQEALKTK